MARLLGERIDAFTCAHIAAAVSHGGVSQSKAELVKVTAPMANDMKSGGKELITAKLSQWELIMAEDALNIECDTQWRTVVQV